MSGPLTGVSRTVSCSRTLGMRVPTSSSLRPAESTPMNDSQGQASGVAVLLRYASPGCVIATADAGAPRGPPASQVAPPDKLVKTGTDGNAGVEVAEMV